MKMIIILIIFLCSFQAQAACRCTCVLTDQRLCASDYDMDHPCHGLCPNQSPATGPIGWTACPVIRIYNQFKGIYQFKTLCPE